MDLQRQEHGVIVEVDEVELGALEESWPQARDRNEGMSAGPFERLEGVHPGDRGDEQLLLLGVNLQLIVRAFHVGVGGGNSVGDDFRLEAPFVHDFQTPDVTSQTTVDDQVVPDPYRADLGPYDAVIEVTGEHDTVHPLTSQCQGQQVTLRIYVERDAIQNFRRLARDVATRRRRADKWLHDHQEMHGEFVFFWSHLVLTSSELGGEQRE